MTEPVKSTEAISEVPVKKELTEDQKFARMITRFNGRDGKVHGVNDRQLSSILKRQKRKTHEKAPRLNEVFAIVLSTVFDTTTKSKDGLVGTTLR